MAITRRTLLTYGLGGAGLLMVGGVGLGLRPSVITPSSTSLSSLDELEYSILRAVAGRVCPGGHGYPSADEVGVAERVDALLITLDDVTVGEIKLLLRLLENALPGLLLDGRVQTFTASSEVEQDRVLEAWRTSRVYVRRGGFSALRGLCASSYFSHPSTYAGSGYPGPPDFSGAQQVQEAG
jgi:hypothetical protein